MEITVHEFNKLKKGTYLLFDIRKPAQRNYGSIEGSLEASGEELLTDQRLDREKKIIVYCFRGLLSKSVVDQLVSAGYEAYSLTGGYMAYMQWEVNDKKNEETCAKVEHSLQKRFRRDIWSRFIKALKEYELVNEGDKIAVCMSGGKDSMLMAKLFQELKKHSPVNFEVIYLVMDPGYNRENRQLIEANAKMLNVPIEIVESTIFDSVFHVDRSPCYLCARMRRGYLYKFAQDRGCNKIALGHHYDDVIETILMSILYGGQVQTMMPKLHSDNFEGMELIRPLYLIREKDIKAWRDYNGLHFLQCACKFTDTCSTESDGETNSKRLEVKRLIAELKKTNPDVEKNIFAAMENVNIDQVIMYKQKRIRHHFLSNYDENEEGNI